MESWKKFGRSTLTGVAMVLVLLVFNVVMNGIPLAGRPKPHNVTSVTVSFQDGILDETKTVTGDEDITLACQLAGSGNYSLFREPEGGEPIVTITYHLTDGRDMVLQCNETTVWWMGGVRALRQERVLVNLTEGVFFFPEAVEQKGADGNPA